MFQVVTIEKSLHFVVVDDANSLIVLVARTLTRVHFSNPLKIRYEGFSISEMIHSKIVGDYIVSTGIG